MLRPVLIDHKLLPLRSGVVPHGFNVVEEYSLVT